MGLKICTCSGDASPSGYPPPQNADKKENVFERRRHNHCPNPIAYRLSSKDYSCLPFTVYCLLI